MTPEELRAEVERLRTSNERLSRHIIGMSDTLETSRRELLATGWDAGLKRGREAAAWAIGMRPDSEMPSTDNPYRKPIPSLGGDD